MTRPRILDFMQNYRFWLFDVVPSGAFPFYVLGSPLLGFSAISSPEYTADVDEIKQCNSMFKRHAYSGGSVGAITLSRGVRGFDDSMWEWMYRAIKGLEVTQRNLLLIQYTNISMIGSLDAIDNKKEFPYLGDTPLEIAKFLPGKAWLLWNCIPVSYRSGSGLDGTSSDVSIAELSIQPDAMSEFSLLDPL